MCLVNQGAGKSTLLNALLGHEALETGEVRESELDGIQQLLSSHGGTSDAGVIVPRP